MISAYIILRKDSHRVKNKNFLSLKGIPLYKWILKSLSSVDLITEIIINTDCEELLELDEFSKVRTIQREIHLRSREIVANELIKSNIKIFKNIHILMTHVTNPLLQSQTILEAINIFKETKGIDSLFAVNKHVKRFYDEKGLPINHEVEALKQTQELSPIYCENSCLYIFTKESFLENDNRIGKQPHFFETPMLESIDLDDPQDWEHLKLLVSEKQ